MFYVNIDQLLLVTKNDKGKLLLRFRYTALNSINTSALELFW